MGLLSAAINGEDVRKLNRQAQTMLRKLLAPMGALLVLTAATFIAAPTYVASGTTPLNTEEQAFLTLINNYRQQKGLGVLTVDPGSRTQRNG